LGEGRREYWCLAYHRRQTVRLSTDLSESHQTGMQGHTDLQVYTRRQLSHGRVLAQSLL
jgi:hypothetical protein